MAAVNATFYSRYEKALRASGTGDAVNGRLRGSTKVTIADLADPTVTREHDATFELLGPGDVDRLGPNAITRRFPAPGSSDAEETKVPLVEFAAVDLPWRYTPRRAASDALQPWLVLVVGRRSPDELTLRPDGKVDLGPTTRASYDLAESAMWAHVHDVPGGRPIARLMSPIDLAKDTEYVACLVPAFTADGDGAWTSAQPATVDCFDQWSFRTGPEGDFPFLAMKLHKASVPMTFGRAAVTYHRRHAVGHEASTLETAGALRLAVRPSPDPAEEAPAADVASEVARLDDRISTPDGREVITAPSYPAPFTDPDSAAPPGGWIEQIDTDPRVRGTAGLGVWAAIEWQDRIADAAATKAGDMAIARDRVRHVALGLEASRSLWRRHLPELPEGGDEDARRKARIVRLAVLMPSLGRLPTDSGESVLDRVAGRTPRLGRAVLSSAGRRALRPGPARTGQARHGAGRPDAVLDAANSCPDRPIDPSAIPWDEADLALAWEKVEEAVKNVTADIDTTSRVMESLRGRPLHLAEILAALRALAPTDENGRPSSEAVEGYEGNETRPFDRDVVQEIFDDLRSLPAVLDEIAPEVPCEPVDIERLSDVVSAAIDPTVERPMVVDRVLSTLPGITGIGPPEIEPELDLPLWSFLSNRSPDWMLPGAGDLGEHEVVALSTNQAFVQALLVGANHQTTAELRWRDIPMTSGWSPLRKFWQRLGGKLDIAPIKSWPGTIAFGSTALADEGRGDEAVVAFRTPLFHRYPATVVYLYDNGGTWDAPPDDTALEAARRKDPTFTGTIGDEITFFGFAVPPTAFATHWVVLEEPPAGFRFTSAKSVPSPDANSAHYAYNRFALPVRVLIGELL